MIFFSELPNFSIIILYINGHSFWHAGVNKESLGQKSRPTVLHQKSKIKKKNPKSRQDEEAEHPGQTE